MSNDVDPVIVYSTLRKAAGKEDHERAIRALYAHALEQGAELVLDHLHPTMMVLPSGGVGGFCTTEVFENGFPLSKEELALRAVRAEAERIMKG